MEEWERQAIIEHLPDLISQTVVNGLLLAILQSKNVISRTDVDILDAKGRDGGASSKANKLYDILISRTGAYEILLQSLLETNQSGAALILQTALKTQREGTKNYLEDSSKEALTSESDNESDVSNPDTYSDEEQAQTTFIEPIKDFAGHAESINPKLIVISTMDANLTILRIQETFTNREIQVKKLNAFRPLKMFFSQLMPSISGNTSQPESPLLLLFCEIEQKNLKNKISSMNSYISQLKIYKPYKNKTVILVLPVDQEHIVKYYFSSTKSGNIVILVDSFKWTNLSNSTRKRLLQQQVVDQGRFLPLKDFCSSYVYENKNAFADTLLHGKLLVDLLNNKEPPIIFRQTIPPVKETYIKRRLTTRHNISFDIFQTVSDNEILVLTGVPNFEKFKLLTQKCTGKVDTSGNQLCNQNMDAQCIFLEYTNHYEKICSKNTGKIVHLLENKKGRLQWKETRGHSLKNIQDCVCDLSRQQELMEENIVNDILDSKHGYSKVFIVSNSAGMGKTVLLAILAKETRRKARNGSIVTYFVMTDFIASVKRLLGNEEQDLAGSTLERSIKDTIFACSSPYDVTDNMFLDSHLPLVPDLYLFFDGLDEVSDDHILLTFKCLQVIKDVFQRAKIVLSTRPHLLHETERHFSILGYHIQPFQPEDQVTFLSTYWSNYRRVEGLPVNLHLLREYATNCLNEIQIKLKQEDYDITGVPLQCLLIGEVFEEEAEQYADPENRPLSEHATPSISIQYITELYDQMIKRKFSSFQIRHLTSKDCKLDEKALQWLHIYLSIKLVFGSDELSSAIRPFLLTKKVFNGLKSMFSEWDASLAEFQQGDALPRRELLSVGIVEAVDDGELQFIHRTFAEYFVAKFTTNYLLKPPNNPVSLKIISDFIEQGPLRTNEPNIAVSKILLYPMQCYEFKHPVVCYFINCLVSSIIDKNELLNELTLVGQHFHKILCASIYHNHDKILKLYSTHIQNQNKELARTLLFLATRFSSFKIFEMLNYTPEIFENCQPTILHLAVEQGNVDMVTHILTKCGFTETIKDWDTGPLKNLVIACISETKTTETAFVEGKCKILEQLESLYPGLISKSVNNDKLSLFQLSVNIELVLILIKYVKSDILLKERTSDNKTILHLLAEHLSADEYERFLMEMKQHHRIEIKYLVIYRDLYGQTPLHCVVRYMSPSLAVLSTFSELQANFNNVDNTGYSIIWTAIRTQKSLECLQKISSLINSDEVVKDKFNRSPLHIAAQFSNEENIVKYLIESGHSVNQTDCYGNTPLFYAIRNSETNKVIHFLFDHKANLDHRNRKKESILHLASELGKLSTLELLFSLSFSLQNHLDKNYNTPLHHALRSNVGDKLETVKCLVGSFKFDVNSKNSQGQCPLTYGLKRRHPDISWQVIEYLEPLVKPWTAELAALALNYIDKQIVNAEETVKFEALKSKLTGYVR